MCFSMPILWVNTVVTLLGEACLRCIYHLFIHSLSTTVLHCREKEKFTWSKDKFKFLLRFEFGQTKNTEGNCLFFKDEWIQSYLVSWTIFHMSCFHWRHLLSCFPFHYLCWWPCKRNISHAREVTHTHFIKVWVVMEAFEDGARFQLSSTGCEKQEIIQGTLTIRVCLRIHRHWKRKDIGSQGKSGDWLLSLLSPATWSLIYGFSVALNIYFLNICFLKICHEAPWLLILNHVTSRHTYF